MSPEERVEQQKRLDKLFRERDKENAEATRIYREQQEAWRANMLRLREMRLAKEAREREAGK
jgi:hypothetical protein